MSNFDCAVIGSGIYGMMTALKLDAAGLRVALLDSHAPGHAGAGSSGLTRAAHTLYDDRLYQNLAVKSLQIYRAIDPNLIANGDAVLFASRQDETTHAQKVIDLGASTHQTLDASGVLKDYPGFSADYACADTEAGVFRMEAVRDYLLAALKRSNVYAVFDAAVSRIDTQKSGYSIFCDSRAFHAQKLLIAAGAGSQNVLDAMNCPLDLGLKLVKPGTLLHLRPRNAAQAERASHRNMPAFAYIERGVFGLPVLDGYTDCVKIAGYYDPLAGDMSAAEPLEFLKEHAPFLLDFEICEPRVKDECRYDYTADGDFIVGRIPGCEDAFIACGWNGGGYKFAPAVTDLLTSKMLGGSASLLDRFSPERLVDKEVKIGCGGRI